MHPSIQTQSAEPLRLADFGAGNGSATFALLWLDRQAKSATRCSIDRQCRHHSTEVLIKAHGLWLLELSRQLPSNPALHGFNISPGMLPAKDWLPTNVHLDIVDAVESDFPKGLERFFDVVHIRAYALVPEHNYPSDLLKNLYILLSTCLPPILSTR